MDLLIFSIILTTLFISSAILAQSTPPISSRINVVGAVYCDTCLNNGFTKHSYFLSGAEVHVQCKFNANAPRTAEMISFSVNRTTDNNGVYKLEIPSVDGIDCVDGPPIQTFCQAALIGSSSSACNVPSLKATVNAVSVKSKQDNLCVYSFTPLSFRPSKKNETLCKKQADELSDPTSSSSFGVPLDFSWPNLPTLSILEAFGPLSFTNPPSFPFPFSSPPPSLPFPFPHLPSNPTTPPLFQSPPPPSFNLGDLTTWIPHNPLISPSPPPPPAFNLRDPRTWTPIFPPPSSQTKNP